MKNLSVKTATDLGPQFTKNSHGSVGMDGAFSIRLGNGETFWYFGDTLFGKRIPNESLWFPGGVQVGPEEMRGVGGVERMLTNTALVLCDMDNNKQLSSFEFILDEEGSPHQPVPFHKNENPDNIRVWCQDGVCLGKKIYLSYVNVKMLAKGPLPVNFELLGTGLAVGRKGEYRFKRLEHHSETLWWKTPLPGFGGGIVYDSKTDYV